MYPKQRAGLEKLSLSVCTCVCVCVHDSCSVVSESLQSCGLWTASLLCPWNSAGKNNGAGYHSLFQGIFPTEGSNPGLPALQADPSPSESAGKSRVCIDLAI